MRAPIHRAIDLASALSVGANRIRRALQTGRSIDDVQLVWMDETIELLKHALLDSRDQHPPAS